ncbi:unnamed protein product [Closterium sp. Yama58-4]|nr:unnamed protein product [Closterium sp. Yama58-4]
MYITLYFLTTRLPDSLRTARDYFLYLDPSELTLASFETRLLEAETSAYAVAAPRGTPSSSFFEGCSPSLLVPSVVATTSLVLRRSVLRLPLVGGAAARVHVLGVGAVGVVEVVVALAVVGLVAVAVVGVVEVVVAVEVAGVVEPVGVVGWYVYPRGYI